MFSPGYGVVLKIYKYFHRNINGESDEFVTFNGGSELSKSALGDKAKEIVLNHVSQEELDTIIDFFPNTCEFLHILHSPRVNSFSKLSSLNKVKYIAITWNNAAESLWDMSTNSCLEGVWLEDFSKLVELDYLMTSSSLEELAICKDEGKKFKIASLTPLTKTIGLKRIMLKRVELDSLLALLDVQYLEELHLSEKDYPVNHYAELAAKMPNVSCECFKGYIDYSESLWESAANIQIVGQRKPSLNSVTQGQLINKHIQSFNSLVESLVLKKT